MVGMPYYREPLLSSWSQAHPLISDAGAPPLRFDQSYLDSLNKLEYGYYGRNTRGGFRNQV